MRKMRCLAIASIILGVALAARAAGVDLSVEIPQKMNVKSAVAEQRDAKLQTAGQIQGQKIVFHNLLPDTPYDLALTLADGTVLQGVDMSWYNEEPAKADAGAMTDDDREQIRAVLQDIKDFMNRKDIVRLSGDHSRAVLLCQLIRDRDFHADKGGEIIWRIELWYFKNDYGGWGKISQVNKVLRRERFTDAAAFAAATKKIQWTPQLGGVQAGKDGQTTLKLDEPKE